MTYLRTIFHKPRSNGLLSVTAKPRNNDTLNNTVVLLSTKTDRLNKRLVVNNTNYHKRLQDITFVVASVSPTTNVRSSAMFLLPTIVNVRILILGSLLIALIIHSLVDSNYKISKYRIYLITVNTPPFTSFYLSSHLQAAQ